jgi:uncharacterized protein
VNRALLVNAAELLRRPGSERDIATTVPTGDLGLDDERFDPADEVAVAVHLESMSDGIVVTGSLSVPWRGRCRRCLRDLHEVLVAPVDELYQTRVTDPEAFEIVGDQLDLTPMVRELALIDAPHAPLCREDCAGLCPTCGIDRNEATCDCVPEAEPSPWDVLDQLKGSADGGAEGN